MVHEVIVILFPYSLNGGLGPHKMMSPTPTISSSAQPFMGQEWDDDMTQP